MSRSVSLPAFAKVNLHLGVLSKRPDGYHELKTLFERIDLADRITVEETSGAGIELLCRSPEVPCDGTNLAVRAAELFRRRTGWSSGIRIHLEKQIPAGGGLGGGSSDAAVTLQALQELAGGPLSPDDLAACARELGSDVPFFLNLSPWAIGTGRGDVIEPVELGVRLWHLLATPDFSIPTKSVYDAFTPPPAPSAEGRPAFGGRPEGPGSGGGVQPTLTPPGGDVTFLLRALSRGDISRVRGLLFNALEPTVEALYPAIRDVKAAVEETRLHRPCVSGTGSTVFALCGSREEAETAARRLRQKHPRWRLFVAATALSSNGRTPEFGSGYLGSNPSGAITGGREPKGAWS